MRMPRLLRSNTSRLADGRALVGTSSIVGAAAVDGNSYLDGGFVAMAHRGGAKLPANLGKENSLAAFGNAVDLGYRYLETDVHVTSDGVLVAFHDAALDRVTDRTGVIAQLPWSQVKQARIGGAEAIPTLDEVLGSFPVKINIDLKAPGAVGPLINTIGRHRAEHRVCVGSFSEQRLRRFRRLAGQLVATSASPSAVGLTAFSPVPYAARLQSGIAYQVPVSHRLGGRELPIVTPRFIDRAHAAGRQVHVWTIDDPIQMNELIDAGVDGLISDRIDILREVLIARGLW